MAFVVFIIQHPLIFVLTLWLFFSQCQCRFGRLWFGNGQVIRYAGTGNAVRSYRDLTSA